MTALALLVAAVTVLPADRLAMADRLFNRGEYAAARAEYAALSGEKSLSAEEVLYRLAECDRALGRSADAQFHEFRDAFAVLHHLPRQIAGQ